MGKRSLLLVDGDARSLRVLEVSLRKAGFLVSTAATGREALGKARTAHPDLIISDTDMAEMDGFELCREVKADPDLSRVPFVFLTGQGGIESKIRGLELGVDEYLTKPIYIKEILTRIRILLQKKQRASLETRRDPNTRFAGTLHDMGVVDLIQTIEVGRKSGLIHFTHDGHQATIYFRNGAVIDAEAGHLQGAEAVYRLLTWSEGEFELLFRTVRRKDAIETPTPALLMEGMRRLDEWGRLLEQLPPLKTRFEVDVAELAERLADLPDDLNRILRLFDGRRSLLDVIDLAGVADLECVELVSRLFFEGLLREVESSTDAAEVSQEISLEGWLGRQIPATGPLSELEIAAGETPSSVTAEWDAAELDGAETLWPSASGPQEVAIDADEPPTPPSGVAHVVGDRDGNGAALGRLVLVRRALPGDITEVDATGTRDADDGAFEAADTPAFGRELAAPSGSSLAFGSDPLHAEPDVDSAAAMDDGPGAEASTASTSAPDLDSTDQDTDPELSETISEEMAQLGSNGLGANHGANHGPDHGANHGPDDGANHEHRAGSNGVSRREEDRHLPAGWSVHRGGGDGGAASASSEPPESAPEPSPADATAPAPPAESIIEPESGPGDIADFDTSDLTPTPLPAPVPLGEERMSIRVKSSLGAEVATVSGELAEVTPPRVEGGRDILVMSPRRAEQIAAVQAPPGTTPPEHAVPYASVSGNGRLRSVELDQELSAAAEVIELQPARLRALPPPPPRAEKLPALDDEDRTPRGASLGGPPRISSMMRAAAGRAFARTFTVTVAGAMLVGALFGLLFWWLGGRDDVAAPVESEIADSRTPIAAGSGALAPAASLPVDAPAAPAPAEQFEKPAAAVAADPLEVAAPPATYEHLYAEARRARRERDHEAMLDFTTRAIEQRPTVQVYFLQAEALLALDQPERALAAAESGIALRRRYAPVWFLKGRIHRALGQIDRAREAFEEYLEIDPEGRRADQAIDYIQDM